MGVILLHMSDTSDNTEKTPPSFPPPRPAVFGGQQAMKAKRRVSTASSLRRALISAASEVGGDEGLQGYLKFLATGSASDRAAFVSLLGKLLPRAVAVQAEISTGVQVVLRWLQESRGVDATPPGGVVIDQPVENIDESDDV